jgi:hypothetical protein
MRPGDRLRFGPSPTTHVGREGPEISDRIADGQGHARLRVSVDLQLIGDGDVTDVNRHHADAGRPALAVTDGRLPPIRDVAKRESLEASATFFTVLDPRRSGLRLVLFPRTAEDRKEPAVSARGMPSVLSLTMILDEAVRLPKRQQEKLAMLLRETSLSSTIGAVAKVVSDRLKFLNGLVRQGYSIYGLVARRHGACVSRKRGATRRVSRCP